LPRDRNKAEHGDPLHSSSAGRIGLIVAHYGISVEVLFEDGERSMVRVKRNSGHVVGDAVLVRDDLLSRLPRKTELRRRDARGGLHLVAANLDVLGIVVAPMAPDGFIDRAIVAARAVELHPFVVVNKCDLPGSEELTAAVKSTYVASVPVFPLSAMTGEGLAALRAFFAEGHRGAFVGTTGVGKSSLLNALCPEIDLRTAEVSDYKSMGRHTTTVSTLHALPEGGELVDTPGFRDFGLVEISPEELAAHFPGFEKAAEVTCRFRNCRHRTEPGCAVVELVAKEAIPVERYETYLVLLTEVEIDEEERKRRGWRKS
jgi:ribosome biogenesis GTPase / thiamine phosphate phosphatase